MKTLALSIEDHGSPKGMVMIITDGIEEDDFQDNPVADIDPSRRQDYAVGDPIRNDDHSIEWISPEATAQWPDHRNVRIALQRLYTFNQISHA